MTDVHGRHQLITKLLKMTEEAFSPVSWNAQFNIYNIQAEGLPPSDILSNIKGLFWILLFCLKNNKENINHIFGY